jgi:hypothetical protein
VDGTIMSGQVHYLMLIQWSEVVGDVAMVAIPRYAPAGLFGDCTANLLWEHLHASDTYRFTKGVYPAGRYYQFALPRHVSVQLDLFLAQPDNWGLTLLVRTGSAAFSTAMLARWKRQQGLGRARPGSVDGRPVTRGGRTAVWHPHLRKRRCSGCWGCSRCRESGAQAWSSKGESSANIICATRCAREEEGRQRP